MSILNNHVDKNLAESFLHFLEDDNYSINSQTYCQEKSNTYHDTSYIWCKVCDKIYCTRCSLNHLIKNQIDHTPSEKAFLRKEHLDVEFQRDCKKINEIQKYIDEFFNKNKNNMSQNEYKSICEIYAKFSEFVKDLSGFLENFKIKIQNAMNNILSKSKNADFGNKREDYIRQNFKDMKSKFQMIDTTFCKNKDFLPTQLKSYHDNLLSGYKDYQQINQLLENNKTRNNIVAEIGDDCYKIKNILTNAINCVKGCRTNCEKLMNELKS